MFITAANLGFGQAASITKQTPAAQQAVPDFSVSMEITVTATTEIAAPRTVDDVKREFHQYLDSLPISPGLSKTAISVNVTDAAFEKMLSDPGYMQKMKDLCARDLCDPRWGHPISPSAINVTIDADCEEEYLASSYNMPGSESKANPDGFWTRRTKKNKEALQAQVEWARQKREFMKLLQAKAGAGGAAADTSSFAGAQGIAAYVSSTFSISQSMTGVIA